VVDEWSDGPPLQGIEALFRLREAVLGMGGGVKGGGMDPRCKVSRHFLDSEKGCWGWGGGMGIRHYTGWQQQQQQQQWWCVQGSGVEVVDEWSDGPPLQGACCRT
jgi:hypothetical protein